MRGLAVELEALSARLQPHFPRREAREAALGYVRALLGRAERKNAWGLAEDAGHAAPYAFQHLLLRAKWDADSLRDDVLGYAREVLGEGGVPAVDETGFLKKGDKSVGVARQYTGAAGQVENAQVGVFLAYVTPKGHALVDREVYLPDVGHGRRASARGWCARGGGLRVEGCPRAGHVAACARLGTEALVGGGRRGVRARRSPALIPQGHAPAVRAGSGLQHPCVARYWPSEAWGRAARVARGGLGGAWACPIWLSLTLCALPRKRRQTQQGAIGDNLPGKARISSRTLSPVFDDGQARSLGVRAPEQHLS
ncbi:transposase [Myxococcus sp. SDU36]|nr:transposase [Myxococcus sp. SDU36]